jgi:large subunit ribosomal protein L17
MRHGKKFNHLGRTASHRKAMLSNMASSLIKNKRINTTVAKAKALRKFVEPLITKAKDNTTQSRRVVFSYLQDKESVTELFSVVADKTSSRPGGYTRIIKTGARLGDNAEMCMMELVDFNELLITEEKPKKSRRSRRGGKNKEVASQDTAVVKEKAEEQELDTANNTPETNTTAEVAESEKSEEPKADADEESEENKEEKKD